MPKTPITNVSVSDSVDCSMGGAVGFAGLLPAKDATVGASSEAEDPRASEAAELGKRLGTRWSLAASRASIWSASPGLVSSAYIGSSSPFPKSLFDRSVSFCFVPERRTTAAEVCFCCDPRNREKSPPRRDPARTHSFPARRHCKHEKDAPSDEFVLGNVSDRRAPKISGTYSYSLTDHI